MNISLYIPISGVGKSSIITRYLKGDYRKECEATIGASFMYAKVTIRDYQITLKVLILFLSIIKIRSNVLFFNFSCINIIKQYYKLQYNIYNINIIILHIIKY